MARAIELAGEKPVFNDFRYLREGSRVGRETKKNARDSRAFISVIPEKVLFVFCIFSYSQLIGKATTFVTR